MTTIIASLFALFIVAYMGVQVWRWAYDPVQTVSAVYIETDDSIELDGMIVRDEKVISSSGSGALQMALNEGERTAKGDMIAMLYSSEKALENNRKVREIDERIDQMNNLIKQGNEVVDLDTADKAVSEQVQTVMELVSTNSYRDLYDEIDELKIKTMSREYVYQDRSGLTKIVDELKAERKKYANSGDVKKRIYSPSSGYFSHKTDGFEDAVNTAAAEAWTPSSFDELAGKDAVASADGTIGKIVYEYTWNYVDTIDEEQAKRLKVGNKVRLKFDNSSFPVVDGVISRVSEAENGKVLVVIECTKHISDFTEPRFIKAQLVLRTYSGLKVPREALRVNDEGINGVYCLIESQVKFKAVEPIFEKDSYYIVDYDSADTKSLLLYDEIVVAAKELENKKIVK